MKKHLIYFFNVISISSCTISIKTNTFSDFYDDYASSNVILKSDGSSYYSNLEYSLIASSCGGPSSIDSTISSSSNLDINGCKFEYFWDLNLQCQDGCVYKNTLFLFNSNGECDIYDLRTKTYLSKVELPSYKGFVPHCNSACFGKKIVETDSFPLVYVNVYNNYPDDTTTYGLCLVYRIDYKIDFSFELVQAIKVGFTNDLDLWYNNSPNQRPFGNFVVVDDNIWVFLNIFGSSITRFFKFDLPKTFFENNKVDFILLNSDCVKETFDTFLFNYIQGVTSCKNIIYSLEGFGTVEVPAFLQKINLETKEVSSFNLNHLVGYFEPEFIDFFNNTFIIGSADGILYKLD